MPRLVTSSDQNRFIDPYQQRIHSWGDGDPKYYLSRTINSLLVSIGNDIVLDGLNVTVTHTDTTVTATVSPGLLIQDNTILELENEITLELENANIYLPDGHIVVACKYQYIQTPDPNPFIFEITYISSDGIPAYTPYMVEKNRTLLDIFNFEVDVSDNITAVYQSYTENIDVYGQTFYRHGHCKDNVQSKKLRKYLIDHIKIIDYDYELECGDVVCVDTTLSSITLSLPSDPMRGDYVTIMDFQSTFGTNQVNIDRNDSLIKGTTSNLSIGNDDEWMKLRYAGDRQGWLVESPSDGAGLSYTLPPATTSTLGGIIVGSGLTIDGSGLLTANPAGLSPATDSVLGGVIIGSGLTVDGSGLITVESQTDENYTTTEKNKLSGIEDDANNYALQPASALTLGGIKVGTGLSITVDGTLSASASGNIGDLSDVESSMGTSGQILMVNATNDGLEYNNIPSTEDIDCGTFT